ncbi:MAG TPA: PAS domain-containing sensor histidine kinase, partial [Desulfobacteraceae bacterium]|nr:PAS domain-containing sensor histidine kinase [Desulfobacteraceae bacterium]
LGYPANIEKKMTLDNIFSRETKKHVLTAFGKLGTGAAEGDRAVVEAEHLHHNGGKVWMEISATVLKDGDGKPIGFTGVSRDITERKRAEEALRRNDQELQWLFRSMFNAFVLFESVFDENGRFISYRFVRINDAYERITGVKNEEVKGKTVHEVWPETEPEWIRRYGEVAVTGISQTFDLYHDPTKKLYHCNVYRPWDTKDRFCVIFEDITEQKRLEAERAALQAQNWQLQKAESLGRMAGATAHHFNNQLQTVMGNLELAMGDLPPGEGPVVSMTEAMKAAHRAARVSRQMLTYLGQTAGRRERLDMAETCRQTLSMLKAALPKEVVVKTDLPSSGPWVHGNSNEVRQVLTNLFTNALEAMAETGGAIHVSLKTVSASGIPPGRRFPIDWRPEAAPYACLEVRDTGAGIPGQDMEKLFDPFFSTKFTGRGLGLSVVLGIVRAHGGGVMVESGGGAENVLNAERGTRSAEEGVGSDSNAKRGTRSGEEKKQTIAVRSGPCALRQDSVGTVFRVFLPVSEEEVVRPAEKAAKVPERKGGSTVLLVEDTEQVRKLGVRMLELLGWKALAAKDGIEGVDMFQQNKDEIRFVLCDLSMPRMDGWNTLEALRKIEPDIPVILASGYDEASVMSGEHAEWPQAFLGKPYSLEDLRTAIRNVLRLEPNCGQRRVKGHEQSEV